MTMSLEVDAQEKILKRSEIIAFLDAHKVPWPSWKKNPTCRTLRDLCRYHRQDRFYFRNGTLTECIIDVHAVVVIVIHQFNGKWWELYEDRQVFPNGREMRRSEFNGIAETIRRGELLSDAAMRCLAEELQFRNPSKYDLSEYLEVQHRKPTASEKWDGLKATYHRYLFVCEISRKLYLPEGYVASLY